MRACPGSQGSLVGRTCAATEQLKKRRLGLASRRANLATARSLLSNLEASFPSASALSLPESIPALQARCAALQVELDTLRADSARARAILTQELVSVYGLRRIVVEQPLPDPFLAAPLTHSVAESASLSPARSIWRAQTAPEPIPPTYTLASLPLPRLSNLLSTLPSHAHLEALLSHLAYLIRLLALYEGVILPFVPLPSCFGAGRAGVRVAVGWGSAPKVSSNTAVKRSGDGDVKNIGLERDDGSSSTPTPSPQSSDRPSMTVSEGDCFPLCFGLSSHKATTRRRHARDDPDGPAGEATATDDGSEDGHSDSPRKLYQEEDGEDERSSRSRKKRVSTSSKRAKGVLLGAVALAFDLAYIAWRRSRRSGVHASTSPAPRSQQIDWWDPAVLDDLGGLLLEAAGVSLDHDRCVRRAFACAVLARLTLSVPQLCLARLECRRAQATRRFAIALPARFRSSSRPLSRSRLSQDAQASQSAWRDRYLRLAR